jgi:glycosyltransferase involved in cell wall biosynthesis
MKTPETILFILPSLTKGGAEKQALCYAKAIRDQGAGKPVIIGLGKQGELIADLEREQIPFYSFQASPFFGSSRLKKIIILLRYRAFLRKLRPQTIIAFTYWPNVLTGLVWRLAGGKNFYWNQRSVDALLPLTFWEKMAMRSKPKYLANGIAPASFIEKRHNLPKGSVKIIYNALEFHEGCTPPDTDTLNLLMLANFFPEKDHATVLRAFARIAPEFPDACLHFAGAAPGRSTGLLEAKALAYDLSLCGRVVFHGAVSDPGTLLSRVHVGILSTRSEGFSNALMEYMAYGLPVLATDIEANRDALGPQNEPWLFPVGDADKLAALLRALLSDESLRNSLGRQNRTFAEERFDMNRFNQHVNTLFAHGGS